MSASITFDLLCIIMYILKNMAPIENCGMKCFLNVPGIIPKGNIIHA